jgi:hypothetical protein
MDMSSHNHKPEDFIPTSLRNSISKIQKYYMLESRVGTLPKEFFDVDHIAAYSMVGMKSALHDTALWALGYVVLGGIAYYIQYNALQGTPLGVQTLQFFDWTIKVPPLYWSTKFASFGYLATSTGCCIYMSQYYIGAVCKRAIGYLFINRFICLIVFFVSTFLVLGVFRKYVFSEVNLIMVGRIIYRMHPDTAERLYDFFLNYFRRSLFESGIVSLVASSASIVLPLLSATYFKFRKRTKKIAGPAE